MGDDTEKVSVMANAQLIPALPILLHLFSLGGIQGLQASRPARKEEVSGLSSSSVSTFTFDKVVTNS